MPELPLHDLGPWLKGLRPRREDIYGGGGCLASSTPTQQSNQE
jgi:hypothetical protein